MNRSSLLVTIFCVSFLLAGCGAAFVGAVWNPGTTFTTSGMVTVVQLGVASDGHGTAVAVTLVTLVDVGITKIMTFCGDQRPQFPVGQTVKAEFASGVLCSTVVSVTCSPPASSNANLSFI